MRRSRSPFFAALIGALSFACPISAANNVVWTNLDYLAGYGTTPTGISGNLIAGEFQRTENSITVFHGFVYDGSTFSILDNPSAIQVGSNRSFVNGVDGNNIVGWYGDGTTTRGFLYSAGTWQTLYDPLATDATFPLAISGTKIVGYYTLLNNGNNNAFVYDTSTHAYQTLKNPSFPSYGTTATGVSGNKIVGFYNSALGAPPGSPSFLYDGTTWTALNHPLALHDETYAQGIDGNNIVGYYSNATGYHGFLFDGTTWTTLDYPNVNQTARHDTFVSDISGNNIVGWYIDSTIHSFTATLVPEPSGLVLALVGIVGAVATARRRLS